MPSNEPEKFKITPARRYATPQIMAIWGVTFSGKTYGALLLAAGLVKPGGKIGFIDTENGRGSMYADDPDIRAAMPQGYSYLALHPPFHPARYVAAIHALEQAGMDLIIVDSGSHAWEGDGGCLDIAEADKGRWQKAKLANKRFMAAIRYSPCHLIVCLRAMDKTKIIDKKDSPDGKEHQISLGILPICEKSFPFELGLAFNVAGEVDGKPATHFARPRKYPKALGWLFDNWQPQLLTAEVGQRIREWNDGATPGDVGERLRYQAAATAAEGTAAYQAFWRALTKGQRLTLAAYHAGNKEIAAAADRVAAEDERPSIEEVSGAIPGNADIFPAAGGVRSVDKLPDPVPLGAGARVSWSGAIWVVVEGPDGFDWEVEKGE